MGTEDQMASSHFQVVVSDYSVSVDEWRRARSAPKGDLPPLSQAQREVASKFGISEEEYARSVLAGRYGVLRLRTRATKLGEEVDKILFEVSPACRVVRVIADMVRNRWVVFIETPNREVGVSIPRGLGDDFLDSGTRETAEELKARVKSGLELGGRGVSSR